MDILEDMECGTCKKENGEVSLCYYEQHSNTLRCPVHGEVTPIIRCTCGFLHVLSLKRNTEQSAIVCHSCFRSLRWEDGVPVARRATLLPGTDGKANYKQDELPVIEAVKI